MTQQQLIALILSAPFAVALTSIIRRLSQRADGTPRIDGPALVWGVTCGLSVIGNVLLVLTMGGNAAASAWAVGIGTAAPGQKLSVAGGITAEIEYMLV